MWFWQAAVFYYLVSVPDLAEMLNGTGYYNDQIFYLLTGQNPQ